VDLYPRPIARKTVTCGCVAPPQARVEALQYFVEPGAVLAELLRPTAA